MAKRTLIRGGKAIPCEHPAGGVFFVRPLPTKELLSYREELKAKGVDVIGDEESGAKVAVRSDVEELQEFVDFVKRRVECVADFVDDTEAEIPSTPDFIEELLWQILPDEDGKKKLVATWILNQAVELANGQRKLEVKN